MIINSVAKWVHSDKYRKVSHTALTSCCKAVSQIFFSDEWPLKLKQNKLSVRFYSEFRGLVSNLFSCKVRQFTSTPEKESKRKKLHPIRVASDNTKKSYIFRLNHILFNILTGKMLLSYKYGVHKNKHLHNFVVC